MLAQFPSKKIEIFANHLHTYDSGKYKNLSYPLNFLGMNLTISYKGINVTSVILRNKNQRIFIGKNAHYNSSYQYLNYLKETIFLSEVNYYFFNSSDFSIKCNFFKFQS